MQTFLPYPDFEQSARCLDMKRLGNQRNETSVILATLSGLVDGSIDLRARDAKVRQWSCHPAILMWYGYRAALLQYQRATILEFIRRGGNNTLPIPRRSTSEPIKPFWFGDPTFHAAHRGNLLRKHVDWYSQFDWNDDPGAEYVWPVRSMYVKPVWDEYRGRHTNAYRARTNAWTRSSDG